ncbi:MAG: DUF6265 family protein [Pyrinomonadaceae bacterium]
MLKNLITLLSLLAFCIGISAQSNAKKIENLAWLSGCWESNDKAKRSLFSEQWMKPAGGMMLGVGRTVKNGKAVDFEFLRIEQRADDIFFIAKPKANKEETPFKLINLANSEVTFENPEHDFPQRVIYKRRGTKLTGRIEGNNNGKFLGIDFPLTRIRCE